MTVGLISLFALDYLLAEYRLFQVVLGYGMYGEHQGITPMEESWLKLIAKYPTFISEIQLETSMLLWCK